MHDPGVGGLPFGFGSCRGQANVAVAVWIVPSAGFFASAIIVAFPLAYAVTIPALAPGPPPELVFTGKSFGKEDIQVRFGELVRSLT